MSALDFSTMKVADLKRELKARGLSATGNKQDLLDRLQMATMSNESDLLNDDEELLAEPTAADKALEVPEPAAVPDAPAAVAAEPVAAAPAPAAPAAAKRPADTSENGSADAAEVGIPPPVKKTAITGPSADDPSAVKSSAAATAATDAPADGDAKPKVTTDADRAAARAARFGISSEQTKKDARAERFGIKSPSSSSSSSPSSKIGAAPAVDLETLKKRAERFGQSNSNALKKAELDEKIKHRQERFGAAATDDKGDAEKPKVQVNPGTNSVVLDEKMKKRAERFGITA